MSLPDRGRKKRITDFDPDESRDLGGSGDDRKPTRPPSKNKKELDDLLSLKEPTKPKAAKKKKKKVVRTIPLLPKITKKKPPRIIKKEKATAKAKGVLKRMGETKKANKGTAKDIKGYYNKATKYPKEMKEQKD